MEIVPYVARYCCQFMYLAISLLGAGYVSVPAHCLSFYLTSSEPGNYERKRYILIFTALIKCQCVMDNQNGRLRQLSALMTAWMNRMQNVHIASVCEISLLVFYTGQELCTSHL